MLGLYSSEDLTVLFNVALKPGFNGEVPKIYSFAKDSGNILIININQFHHSCFKNENSLGGKAIRLLAHLNDACSLKSNLMVHAIRHVYIIDDPNLQALTKPNSVLFETKFLNEVFTMLSSAEFAGANIKELSIQTLIAENTRTKS